MPSPLLKFAIRWEEEFSDPTRGYVVWNLFIIRQKSWRGEKSLCPNGDCVNITKNLTPLAL